MTKLIALHGKMHLSDQTRRKDAKMQRRQEAQEAKKALFKKIDLENTLRLCSFASLRQFFGFGCGSARNY